MLRDSACFAASYIGFSYGIQQAGFSVIDVAHHRDYRRARNFIASAFFLDAFFLNHLLFERNYLHDSVKRFRQAGRSRHVERLIDAGENAAVQQRLQQVLSADVQLLRQLADRNSFGDCDRAWFALNWRNRFHLCGTSRASACTRPHGMKFTFTFSVTFLDKRASARCGRLPRIQRLAWLGFGNACAGPLSSYWTLPRTSSTTTARPLREARWRSTGARSTAGTALSWSATGTRLSGSGGGPKSL